MGRHWKPVTPGGWTIMLRKGYEKHTRFEVPDSRSAHRKAEALRVLHSLEFSHITVDEERRLIRVDAIRYYTTKGNGLSIPSRRPIR